MRSSRGGAGCGGQEPRIDALVTMRRALDYTRGDRFVHDAALPLPPWSVLESLRRLAATPRGSDDERFAAVDAIRARNRIAGILAQARRALASPPDDEDPAMFRIRPTNLSAFAALSAQASFSSAQARRRSRAQELKQELKIAMERRSTARSASAVHAEPQRPAAMSTTADLPGPLPQAHCGPRGELETVIDPTTWNSSCAPA